MITGTDTWGISGPDFLWFYAGLSAAIAAGIGYAWWLALGAPDAGAQTARDLDMYELALLNGGPELAVTTAATQLLREGALRRDVDGSLVAGVAPDIDAHRLEREAFYAVRRAQTNDADGLQDEMADSATIRSLRNRLIEEGLMLEQSRAARLRRAWLLGAGLGALGVCGLVAGAIDHAPVGLLGGSVGAVILGTAWLARRRPNATARGRQILNRWRQQDLQRLPQVGYSAMAVALFGGATLWLSDPEIAAALGVARESAAGGGGSNGRGCGGCGVG